MKKLLALMALVFIGVVGWRVAEGLSSDAIGMALGVLFGVLAGIPTALFVIAANRRQEERPQRTAQEYGAAYPYHPPQPPVIVVTGHSPPQQGHHLPAYENYPPQMSGYGLRPASARSNRQFIVGGENEELLGE
jgi:hypothetical protein